jgi:aspartate/methionine/tyrosine aminotransferase
MTSDRIKNLNVSPTMNIAAKALMMKRENIDVIDLSVGEPDFATPDHIKEAAIKAIRENKTKYTLNKGLIELREAIARKLKRDNGLNYSIDQIIVSSGAKQSILNSVLSLVNRNDEVLVPVPYWVSYPEIVKLAEGRTVFVPTRQENAFKLTPELLKEYINPATKLLILCNPSNPTGTLYTMEDLQGLSDIVLNEDITVIADEIYEKLVYDNRDFVSVAAINAEMKDKTVIVNGVSKSYAMTGWRIGYAAGPLEIINGADKIQSHSTSNASTISQFASIEALSGPQDEIERMRVKFQERRNFAIDQLRRISNISCIQPEGAFYIFPNISGYYGYEYNGSQIQNSYDLAYYLLNEAKVAVIPGAAFGSENHIRLSYATSMSNLEKGLSRIIKALNNLALCKNSD